MHIFTPDIAPTSKQQLLLLLLRCGSCIRCQDVQVRWMLAVHDRRDPQIVTLIVCGCPIEREDQEHRHDELSMVECCDWEKIVICSSHN